MSISNLLNENAYKMPDASKEYFDWSKIKEPDTDEGWDELVISFANFLSENNKAVIWLDHKPSVDEIISQLRRHMSLGEYNVNAKISHVSKEIRAYIVRINSVISGKINNDVIQYKNCNNQAISEGILEGLNNCVNGIHERASNIWTKISNRNNLNSYLYALRIHIVETTARKSGSDDTHVIHEYFHAAKKLGFGVNHTGSYKANAEKITSIKEAFDYRYTPVLIVKHVEEILRATLKDDYKYVDAENTTINHQDADKISSYLNDLLNAKSNIYDYFNVNEDTYETKEINWQYVRSKIYESLIKENFINKNEAPLEFSGFDANSSEELGYLLKIGKNINFASIPLNKKIQVLSGIDTYLTKDELDKFGIHEEVLRCVKSTHTTKASIITLDFLISALNCGTNEFELLSTRLDNGKTIASEIFSRKLQTKKQITILANAIRKLDNKQAINLLESPIRYKGIRFILSKVAKYIPFLRKFVPNLSIWDEAQNNITGNWYLLEFYNKASASCQLNIKESIKKCVFFKDENITIANALAYLTIMPQLFGPADFANKFIKEFSPIFINAGLKFKGVYRGNIENAILDALEYIPSEKLTKLLKSSPELVSNLLEKMHMTNSSPNRYLGLINKLENKYELMCEQITYSISNQIYTEDNMDKICFHIDKYSSEDKAKIISLSEFKTFMKNILFEQPILTSQVLAIFKEYPEDTHQLLEIYQQEYSNHYSSDNVINLLNNVDAELQNKIISNEHFANIATNILIVHPALTTKLLDILDQYPSTINKVLDLYFKKVSDDKIIVNLIDFLENFPTSKMSILANYETTFEKILNLSLDTHGKTLARPILDILMKKNIAIYQRAVEIVDSWFGRGINIKKPDTFNEESNISQNQINYAKTPTPRAQVRFKTHKIKPIASNRIFFKPKKENDSHKNTKKYQV